MATAKDPALEIQELTQQINHLNYEYYQNSISEVSDFEFDQMLKRLEALEAQHPELRLPHSLPSAWAVRLPKTLIPFTTNGPCSRLATPILKKTCVSLISAFVK
ncbi:hypothetical protein GCM10028895_04880 [Pontibacter rugosus]